MSYHRSDRYVFVKMITIVALLYYCVAAWVFSYRHPWATDGESFWHLETMLTFGTISYEEMRPREGGR